MAHETKLRKLIREFMESTDCGKLDSLLCDIKYEASREARVRRCSTNRILYENGFYVGFMSIFYRIADIFKKK